ncbi:hypothetical protein HF086_012050 [Spodoptera exigua]|uniref:Uncharacterized protein n=1 Tax=Spodoptera exigua TaxID=7107 RepID=A0A922MI76_SPOEX|nr:hypothetical protein HF086_012050 [Spodoptera exigua]
MVTSAHVSYQGTCYITVGDTTYKHITHTLLSKDFVPAVEGQEQSLTKVYRAESGVEISMISITAHFSHLPEIVRSPLGKNYIEVTLKSRVGQGLNTTIQTYRWK